LPDGALLLRISEEVRGVIRRHHRDVAVLHPAAAKPRDRRARLEQRVRRVLAERDDHLRSDRRDLRGEERFALGELIRLRIAVLPRSAFYGVCDVDVASLHAHAGFDDLGEQLARFADERFAEAILVVAGTLADEHQLRARVADAEDDLRSTLARELAAGALA